MPEPVGGASPDVDPVVEVGSRREERERALAVLYEAEAKGLSPASAAGALPVPLDGYALAVVLGVGEQQTDLDARIDRLAHNWSLERMPTLDKVVLRMAGFELGQRPDVPTGVILNEAVDLAKRYSTDDSGRFVNGVLAKLAGELRDPAP